MTSSSQGDASAHRLLEQLDAEATSGCGWWETAVAGLILEAVATGPVMAVFTAIAYVLRESNAPCIGVGATTAEGTFAIAQDWLDAGIDATDVVGWLRAGCWKPTAARAMTDAGLRPWRLLDGDRVPLHWVDVPTPDGEQIPLARAVAEGLVSIESAVRVVTRHAS
jgi:hypothetical protein